MDGASHAEKEEYDLKREEYLNGLGIEVMHIMDISVKRSMNEVVGSIQDYIKNRNLKK